MKLSNKGTWVMTTEERQKRWDKCTYYLRRHRSLPEAQAAASKDQVSFDGSVWLSALGKMLEKGQRPGDLIA